METHLTVMDISLDCWISTVNKYTLILKQAKIASSLIQFLVLLFRDKMACEVQPGREFRAERLVWSEHSAGSSYLAIYIWEKFPV